MATGQACGQPVDQQDSAPRAIQLLMRLGRRSPSADRFRIHGRDYGIAYVGGPSFDVDAAVVRLAQFGFRPTERFVYEYDFTTG